MARELPTSGAATYVPTIANPQPDPLRVQGFRIGIPILCPQHQAVFGRALAGDTGPVDPIPVPAEGTSDVGKGPGLLAPGTYRTTASVSDCYWERTSRSGEILDNNFATRAQEIKVTIRAGDGSFTSRGCGDWARA